MIGVSVLPVFLKKTVHSTVGKSLYSTASQRTCSPVDESVQTSVRPVRFASIFLELRSIFHAVSSSGDGLPP